METLFNVAVLYVENGDLHGLLTEATKKIDDLELKLIAFSGGKSNEILEATSDEHDLKLRVNEMEGHIKETYPALTVDEAIKAWARMIVHLGNMVAQLADARKANAELATRFAAAQRGILTAHDLPYVMDNTDASFQFSAKNPPIKILAAEFAKVPGLTLDMAVDRWATFSLGFSELRLEVERYKDDSKQKRNAANENAEAALDLHGAKVARHRTDSKKGQDGVAGKKLQTDAVRDAVFNWCELNRGEPIYRNLFAKGIGELLSKEEVMKKRKAGTLAGFVRDWEKERNYRKK